MSKLSAMDWLRKHSAPVKDEANVLVPRSYLRKALKALDEAMAPRIKEMHVVPGGLEMTIEESTGLVHRMALAMLTMLDNHKAKNYLQEEVSLSTRDYVLLVQRRNGKTPHQLRAEAEARVAELELEIAGLRAESECQVDGIAPCSGAGKTEADWCRMCLIAEFRKARNGLAAAVAEEREACAALMERMAPNGSKLVGLAAAIRARGAK